jgi:hypothetical protein
MTILTIELTRQIYQYILWLEKIYYKESMLKMYNSEKH